MSGDTDFFEEHERRIGRLWEQVSIAPEMMVTGVVSASGAGGSSTGPSDIWTLLFSFDAWRANGGKVETTQLTIRQKMTQDELREQMELINPYDILNVQARLVTDSEWGDPQAGLVKLMGSAEDLELQEISARLQVPITVDIEQFGVMTLDRRLGKFDGRVKWNNSEIELTIDSDGDNICSESLETAKQLFADEQNWMKRINDYVISKLHGKTWLEQEDELELTREEFLSRMTLTNISVSQDGQFEFWHDDGELFWGHSILVTGDLEKGPTYIDTPG